MPRELARIKPDCGGRAALQDAGDIAARESLARGLSPSVDPHEERASWPATVGSKKPFDGANRTRLGGAARHRYEAPASLLVGLRAGDGDPKALAHDGDVLDVERDELRTPKATRPTKGEERAVPDAGQRVGEWGQQGDELLDNEGRLLHLGHTDAPAKPSACLSHELVLHGRRKPGGKVSLPNGRKGAVDGGRCVSLAEVRQIGRHKLRPCRERRLRTGMAPTFEEDEVAFVGPPRGGRAGAACKLDSVRQERGQLASKRRLGRDDSQVFGHTTNGLEADGSTASPYPPRCERTDLCAVSTGVTRRMIVQSAGLETGSDATDQST